jgi:hypothetical protein
MAALNDFFDLVDRSSNTDLNRSENDLSSNLKNVFTGQGLHAVMDTAGGTSRIKRPDISVYVDLGSADLGLAAEIVVEAKRPMEVQSFPTLLDALVSDGLWNDKFIPYIRAHAERVRYFILTSFERMLVVPIDAQIRSRVHEPNAYPDGNSRLSVIGPRAAIFDLRSVVGKADFQEWLNTHALPAMLDPPALSTILDFCSLDGADDLEQFASSLADIVIGPEGATGARYSLLASVRLDANSLDDLPLPTRRALTIYTMSAHGGMSLSDAETYLGLNLPAEMDAFLSASVHSFIGRLFAIKTIEDAFCVGVTPPLVPASNWVFHSTAFDMTPPELLPAEFFAALAALGNTTNAAVRDLAATGEFFDWLAPQVNPVAFRRLLDLFFSHSFAELDGDLLGRFFEVYAQRVDRGRRRELGQYYTPMPIVRAVWRLAMEVVEEHDAADQLVVLDPGVGSGTFLLEGARRLQGAAVPQFWTRLNGFDIAPQVIGVAQVNLYLTVLGLLDRRQADAVGSLHLYPTDTLDPSNGGQLRSLLNLLTDDAIRLFINNRITLSEQVKRQARFPLVIGNPPYKHNSNRTLAQMAERFPTLLRSTRVNARAQENTIREDYAWFFAAADHYLAGTGVIAFVVSDSFCYGRSFRYFREDLLRNYRIRRLVRLGRFIFRDVGPRTSFVIIVMERRENVLASADEAEAIPFFDMADGISLDVAGTQSDPRLLALDAGDLGPRLDHQPSARRAYGFYPAGEAVSTVLRAPVPVIDAPRRVFVKKWPGAVSGFDLLFKNKDRSILIARMNELFDAARRPARQRDQALEELAVAIKATPADQTKLATLAELIAQGEMAFDVSRIKRTLSGSAPRSVAWYPDARMSTWIYYEPRFTFERAVHEDRMQGWGTSNQWREAASHAIVPKLVFTTSTNPQAGLKAFVLDDEWIVLKAAGTRQQLNYTAVDNPLAEARMGEPNNLGGEAVELHRALVGRGRGDEDFLLYVAAIYNSELAGEYLDDGGDNKMRIPVDPARIGLSVVEQLIDDARKMRNLVRLGVELERDGQVDHSLATMLSTENGLAELGIVRAQGSGGRFRQNAAWFPADDTTDRIAAAREAIQNSIDDAVRAIFAALPETD